MGFADRSRRALLSLCFAAACGSFPGDEGPPVDDSLRPGGEEPQAVARPAIRSGAVGAVAVDPSGASGGPVLAGSDPEPEGSSGGTRSRVPPAPSAQPQPAGGNAAGSLASPEPRKGGERPAIRRLDLRRTRPGRIVLSARAPGGVAVRTVRQRPDGMLVRLVFDGVAGLSALGSLPRHIGGVHMAGVRRGSASVSVTVRLDPGWRLVRHRRTDSGAIAVFEGPTW